MASVGPNALVFTVDLGFQYMCMNFGPGCKTDDDRITKSYLARRCFCTYCAGVHDDSAELVCFTHVWGGLGAFCGNFSHNFRVRIHRIMSHTYIVCGIIFIVHICFLWENLPQLCTLYRR